jgi:mannose-1-phosphate guanylyltransferase
MSELYLVVIAGGSGTRFWPKSTAEKPKQFLHFGQKKTLIEQTLNRFEGLDPYPQKMIVTTEKLSEAMKNLVDPSVEVLSEPQGRNTAPCVFWAAKKIAERNPKAVMMVMPADHYIPCVEKFQKTLMQAIRWAEEKDDLVTLGIQPTRAETGYGYLQLGGFLEGDAQRVQAFVEKPNEDKAKKFFESGQYLWNGGMFLWRAEVILSAFQKHLPEYEAVWQSCGGDAEKAYPLLTATSIDYGIMEKAESVITFSLDCGWDDLGSWPSLENLADDLQIQHPAGVVTDGKCVSIDSTGNIVDAPDQWVALLGVRDLIIVRSGKILMVAHKSRAQDVKLLVEKARENFSESS